MTHGVSKDPLAWALVASTINLVHFSLVRPYSSSHLGVTLRRKLCWVRRLSPHQRHCMGLWHPVSSSHLFLYKYIQILCDHYIRVSSCDTSLFMERRFHRTEVAGEASSSTAYGNTKQDLRGGRLMSRRYADFLLAD